MVLMFYVTVASYSPRPGIVGPLVVKKMTWIGIQPDLIDSETRSIAELFNDYLHDKLA